MSRYIHILTNLRHLFLDGGSSCEGALLHLNQRIALLNSGMLLPAPMPWRWKTRKLVALYKCYSSYFSAAVKYHLFLCNSKAGSCKDAISSSKLYSNCEIFFIFLWNSKAGSTNRLRLLKALPTKSTPVYNLLVRNLLSFHASFQTFSQLTLC